MEFVWIFNVFSVSLRLTECSGQFKFPLLLFVRKWMNFCLFDVAIDRIYLNVLDCPAHCLPNEEAHVFSFGEKKKYVFPPKCNPIVSLDYCSSHTHTNKLMTRLPDVVEWNRNLCFWSIFPVTRHLVNKNDFRSNQKGNRIMKGRQTKTMKIHGKMICRSICALFFSLS